MVLRQCWWLVGWGGPAGAQHKRRVLWLHGVPAKARPFCSRLFEDKGHTEAAFHPGSLLWESKKGERGREEGTGSMLHVHEAIPLMEILAVDVTQLSEVHPEYSVCLNTIIKGLVGYYFFWSTNGVILSARFHFLKSEWLSIPGQQHWCQDWAWIRRPQPEEELGHLLIRSICEQAWPHQSDLFVCIGMFVWLLYDISVRGDVYAMFLYKLWFIL